MKKNESENREAWLFLANLAALLDCVIHFLLSGGGIKSTLSRRRLVGRRPLNSVGRDDFQGPRMEQQLMHFAVRSFQLKFWFAGCDMFVLYGRLRELARTDLSAANWKALSDFKLAL